MTAEATVVGKIDIVPAGFSEDVRFVAEQDAVGTFEVVHVARERKTLGIGLGSEEATIANTSELQRAAVGGNA